MKNEDRRIKLESCIFAFGKAKIGCILAYPNMLPASLLAFVLGLHSLRRK